MMDVLTNLVVINSQYKCVSDHHIAHLKLTPCSTSIISQKAGKRKKGTKVSMFNVAPQA